MSTMELNDLLADTAQAATTVRDTLFTELNASHRCDGCGARAVAQINISIGMPNIHLCGHHYRKNLTKFQELGYAVDVPEEANYLFTDREIQARPTDNRSEDRGSA